jgi:hypothetical protein
MRYLIATLLTALGFAAGANCGVAQLIQTTVPLQTFNDSYGESANVSWSLNGPNWFANFGGNGPLLPPFGGVPAGLSTGVGFRAGGVSGNLGLTLGQTSSRSINSTSASVTTMDGVPGFISSTITRPFVTGFTPIVGSYPTIPNHAATIASRDQQQFDRIRQSEQNLKNKSLQKYISRAERAEGEGNKRMARANYRRAIGIAAEPLRSELKLRLREVMANRSE